MMLDNDEIRLNSKSSFYENVAMNNENDGGYLFVPTALVFELMGQMLKKDDDF